MNNLSKDFIIHPGVTVKEKLEDIGITTNELAMKTNFTLDYINGVINEEENITPEFAKVLEKVTDVSSTFWLNLQDNYEKECKTLGGNVING